MLAHNGLGSTVKSKGPSVVAQALPGGKDGAQWRCCQLTESRKEREEQAVFRQDASYLCLLEHYLRYQDLVWVVRPSPRQFAAVLAIVPENDCAESRCCSGRNHDFAASRG